MMGEDIKEEILDKLWTTFEVVVPEKEWRCLVCGGRILGMSSKNYGLKSAEEHLESHGWGNEVRP